jgi:hypothetical protein
LVAQSLLWAHDAPVEPAVPPEDRLPAVPLVPPTDAPLDPELPPLLVVPPVPMPLD